MLTAALVNGHTLSRLAASLFVQTHEYVQDPDTARSRPVTASKLTPGQLAYSAAHALVALLLLAPGGWLLLAVVPTYLAKVAVSAYFTRRIGGYTGDCLGATQQLCEVVFYLSLLALHRLA